MGKGRKGGGGFGGGSSGYSGGGYSGGGHHHHSGFYPAVTNAALFAHATASVTTRNSYGNSSNTGYYDNSSNAGYYGNSNDSGYYGNSSNASSIPTYTSYARQTTREWTRSDTWRCRGGVLSIVLAIVALITTLVVAFSVAPSFQNNDVLYLQTQETRAYPLWDSNRYCSETVVIEQRSSIRPVQVYQLSRLPPLNASRSVWQTPIIPLMVIAGGNNWMWEGYWLNNASTLYYSIHCATNDRINLCVLPNDSAFNSWTDAAQGNTASLQSLDGYCVTVGHNQSTYGGRLTMQTPYIDSRTQGANVYVVLTSLDVGNGAYEAVANYPSNSGSGGSGGSSTPPPPYALSPTATCQLSITINYTVYDTSRLQPACRLDAAHPCTLDGANGAFVIFQAPDHPDPANEYNGPNLFTVQADQYTVHLVQQLTWLASVPGVMMLFGVLVGTFSLLALVCFAHPFCMCCPPPLVPVSPPPLTPAITHMAVSTALTTTTAATTVTTPASTPIGGAPLTNLLPSAPPTVIPAILSCTATSVELTPVTILPFSGSPAFQSAIQSASPTSS